MIDTYISTKQLMNLGASWKPAAASSSRALKKWGLVGFILDREGKFLPSTHDSSSLTESFNFCAINHIPVAADAEAKIINTDPEIGGEDFFTCKEPLDAVVFSWVYRPAHPMEGVLKRRRMQEAKEYYKWISPLYTQEDDWQKAAVRCGAKMIFITGRSNWEMGVDQFQHEGSPYRVLKQIPQQPSYFKFTTQPYAYLGVLVHKEYGCEFGMIHPAHHAARSCNDATSTPNPPACA